MCLRSAGMHLIISKPLQFCLQALQNIWNFIVLNQYAIEFSFLYLKFFCLFVLTFYFVGETGIVINLFLNLEQKWASCSYESSLIEKSELCLLNSNQLLVLDLF